MTEIISFEDFKKLELKVAKILSVEDVPRLDRVYKLKINIGEQNPRTLFAGLKQYCTKEQLIGKTIIVAANLQRKKFGSEESEGMLLAVKAVDGSFALLEPKANATAGEKAVLIGAAAQ